MEDYESMNLKELAEQLISVRDKQDEMSVLEKELNAKKALIEKIMADRMIDEGSSSVKYPGIGSFSLTTSDFPSIINDTVFFEYLKSTGQESMAKYSVNANTLRGWWNKKIDVDLKAESIGLEVHSKIKINVRKA